MKKVRNFKELQKGVLYTDKLGNEYYFYCMSDDNSLAIFLEKTEVESWELINYVIIYFDKHDIKELRYSL